MKPNQIVTAISTNNQVVLSADWGKQFRQWLISMGGKCTPKGDVITKKGNQVHFEPVRRNVVKVSLMEVAQ